MSKRYLYRVQILNKKNSNPLESICYFSGEHQYDMKQNKQFTSNTEDKVMWNNIIIPDKTEQSELYFELPDYLKFRSNKKDLISNARSILWQNVYARETRDDAQFARLFELSIPSFFNLKDAIEGINLFAKPLVKDGMIVDAAIHSVEKYKNNSFLNKNTEDKAFSDKDNSLDYRAFLMCTMRTYKNGMFLKKNREWNAPYQIELWRRNWVIVLNDFLNAKNLSEEDKKHWNHKLSIYHEFDEIKRDNVTIDDIDGNSPKKMKVM